MSSIIFSRQIDTDNRFHAGERVWAWRNGDFVRAKVVAVDSLGPSDPESPVYRVVFEDTADPDAELPASLMRKHSAEKPELIAAHEWHSRRRKMILNAHPEIRELKPFPKLAYFAMMLVLILLHLGVGGTIAAYTDTGSGWLWAVALSATVGAFFAYALQQLTHEICHSSHRWLNRGLVLLGDFMVGTTGPTSYYFYYYHSHIIHHAKSGDEGDPDIRFHGHWAVPPKWLARSRLKRFIWLTLFSLFTVEILIVEHLVGRLPQPERMTIRNKALIISLCGKYAFMALTLWFGGVWCFLYFRLAAGFSLGGFGHPYAGFWLMQHASNTLNGFQPTVSYDGSRLWHWLTLGELYHVEHHDLPWIPFTKIEAVRRIAPEYYRPLYVVPSVWRLTWAWISHTDGSPWMDVACVMNCLGPILKSDNRRRPMPSLSYGVE